MQFYEGRSDWGWHRVSTPLSASDACHYDAILALAHRYCGALHSGKPNSVLRLLVVQVVKELERRALVDQDDLRAGKVSAVDATRRDDARTIAELRQQFAAPDEDISRTEWLHAMDDLIVRHFRRLTMAMI